MNLGFRLFPISASTLSWKVDLLTFCLFGLCLIVLIGVAVAMLYSIVYFRVGSKAVRHKLGPQKYTLEITWSLIPLFLFLGLFVWGSWVYYQMHEVPSNASDIYVVGKQWMWKFEHPNGVRELNELHVPVGEPIRLVMTSQDVIHSIFVPEFRMKQDVLPGRYTYTWLPPVLHPVLWTRPRQNERQSRCPLKRRLRAMALNGIGPCDSPRSRQGLTWARTLSNGGLYRLPWGELTSSSTPSDLAVRQCGSAQEWGDSDSG